ncbi:MAG TPA: hypothetical protein VI306_05985 [Pyrinomonadaceae bacterium]
MSQEFSPILSLLRLIAFLGTAGVLLWDVESIPQLQPRQSAGFIILGLAMLAVGLMLVILSDATERIFRYTDLLVPLGLFVTVSTSFNMLAALPAIAAMMAASWTIKLLTLSLSLSVTLVVTFLLSVAYVGWTTALIFQVVVQGQINLIAPLSVFGRWFWRALMLELLGWGILLTVLAVVLIASIMSMGGALVLLGGLSLIWNLLTAAVLPVVLADSRPFWAAVKDGIRISRARMHKWAPLVIAQMVLLGWVTFIHVSYTHKTEGPGRLTTIEQTTKTDWGVNTFWTGTYADDCKWHGSLMKSLESEPLALVDSLLMLVFAVLAIAIKIRIVSDLYPPRLIYEVSLPDMQSHGSSQIFKL